MNDNTQSFAAIAAKKLDVGLYDPATSNLRDIEEAEHLATQARAVAQMVILGGRTRVDSGGLLHLPFRPLAALRIGGHRLCPGTTSNFGKYKDQRCVNGSTATLIGPHHVLTVAHFVRFDRMIGHHFVFDRRPTASVQVDEGPGELIYPPGSYSSAKRLVAYGHAGEVDWAVLELYRPVEGIEPLSLGVWDPHVAAHVVGHPLGLPLKCADIEAIERTAPLRYRVDTANASGGSGSPIVQDGRVVGVLSGDAGVSREMIVERDAGTCLDPARDRRFRPQPFTPASFFAPCVTNIIG
jgi:hypothetical protein